MEVPVGGGASSTYNTPAKNVQNVQNVPDIDVVDSGKKPASQVSLDLISFLVNMLF